MVRLRVIYSYSNNYKFIPNFMSQKYGTNPQIPGFQETHTKLEVHLTIIFINDDP